MATEQQSSAVATAISPVLARLGLELFDVELAAGGGSRTLRVLVRRDTAAGGLDLDAVAAASEALSAVLDTDPAVAEALPGPYTLEVSSPGLERPLRRPAHFAGAVGERVSVKTRTADGGLRRRGVVLTADDAAVEIDFDGAHERLTYDEIVQARTVFEWGTPRRPKRARGKKKQEVAR
jgi:ribosome maturation factor RimP